MPASYPAKLINHCVAKDEKSRLSVPLVFVTLNGVMALSSQDKVSGNELGALVQELVKGVLSIRRWLAEEDGTRRVLDVVAGACDGLAIGFHG
jgi:hypothetical protein